MSNHTWDFDTDAIQDAADHLGLTYPVRVIGKRGRSSGTVGIYKGPEYHKGQIVHLVVVDRSRSMEFISNTIWHELTHAAQCERYLDSDGIFQAHGEFLRDYAQEGVFAKSRVGRKRYSENKFEIEANEKADQMSDTVLLVKLNKTGRELGRKGHQD